VFILKINLTSLCFFWSLSQICDDYTLMCICVGRPEQQKLASAPIATPFAAFWPLPRSWRTLPLSVTSTTTCGRNWRPPHFKRCVCTVRSGLSLLRGRQAACCVMMPRKQKPGEERREWQSSLVHIGASCISSRIKSRFAFLIFWWIEHRLTHWGLGFPFAAREGRLLERQISACLRSIVVIGSFLEGCDQ
jgi:hypothetical protein